VSDEYFGNPKFKGIFGRLLAFFMPGEEAKAERLRLRKLREIQIDIQNSRFSAFYRAKTKEASAGFADFMYNVYRSLDTLSMVFTRFENTTALKALVINYFMPINAHSIIADLSDENIMNAGKEKTPEELKTWCENSLKKLNGILDKKWQSSVDEYYNRLAELIWLAKFDYPGLLRKFDPRFPETITRPHYEAQFKGQKVFFISENLKDFIAILFDIGSRQDWKFYSDIITRAGILSFSKKRFVSTVFDLTELRKSNILTMMLWHSESMPLTDITPIVSTEAIAADYCARLNGKVREAIGHALSDDELGKRNTLMKTVFGAVELPENIDTGIRNYTAKDSEACFIIAGVSFTHVQTITTLACFFKLYFDEVRMLCNLFLLQAEWTSTAFARTLTNHLENIVTAFEHIDNFDRSLSEAAPRGRRIRQLADSARASELLTTQLAALIKQVNKDAEECVKAASSSLYELAVFLKEIDEDRTSGANRRVNNSPSFDASLPRLSLKPKEAAEKLLAIAELVDL